jgi:hypothetical protein
MRTYNLFRRRDRAELICAVPEDTPVPAFIRAPWELAGGVDDTGISSLTFNHEAAEASVRYNGFYLFQLINASDLQLFVRRGSANSAASAAQVRGEDCRREIPLARVHSSRLVGSGERQRVRESVLEGASTGL